MGRGGKTLEGQLSFDFSVDKNQYVVQANTLITGKQGLKLNSAKLIRSAIMQVVYDDKELKTYVITIAEIADSFGISKSNVYRDIDEVTSDIISNPVYIKSEDAKKTQWIKIPWVTKCVYQSDVGVAIKLNDELKPYLLNLKEKYTQYTLDTVLAMKSVYSIRIFELLMERIKLKVLPKNGVDVELSVEYIREACDCQDKYKTFANLNNRVIKGAVEEINRVTLYKIDISYKKKGRSVSAIIFHVNMQYH